jgi:exodeoxyribonuclease III
MKPTHLNIATLKIATWNINGSRARIQSLLHWLKDCSPDIACLQEIKCVDSDFPRSDIESLGYHVETHGQKGFNGVALLSKTSPNDIIRRLPGNHQDEQSRYIEGVYPFGTQIIRVGCLYLPNGNPFPSEKFDYKLAWIERLIQHAQTTLKFEEPFVLAGDYNIIPHAIDCFNPKDWENDALYQPVVRQAFQRLQALGLYDAVRCVTESDKTYTFWDYQAGSWQKNNGIRIDHILLSPEAANLLVSTTIEKDLRADEKPSDHVPVVVHLKHQ